jgi:putative transposase
VAGFLDGKTFAEDTMVIALGVTLTGEKVVLGFVETSTENAKVCTQFLEGLKARGLRSENGLLVIIDGGKGLHAGVEQAFGSAAAIQRCQWHKRENVLAYLGGTQQAVGLLQVRQDLFVLPDVVAAGEQVDALGQEKVGHRDPARRAVRAGWVRRVFAP